MESIRLITPATTANIGPGFDVFALALEDPYDVMEIVKIPSGIIVESEGYPLPQDPLKNCAGYVADEMLSAFNITRGVKIRMIKNIKPGSGLGSSAASSAGTAYAINKLFGLKLTKRELAIYASHGERVSAGFPHCDNVVACIFGGFTITYSYHPLLVEGFEPPSNLGIVISLPNIDKGSTEVARSLVPEMISRKHLIYNVGHASLLAAGIISNNIDLIKKGMDDCIVEPVRAEAGILRDFFEFKKLGREMSAGIAASGAGPAILGIIEKSRREELARRMTEIYERKGYVCETYLTNPGKGIQEVKKS